MLVHVLIFGDSMTNVQAFVAKASKGTMGAFIVGSRACLRLLAHVQQPISIYIYIYSIIIHNVDNNDDQE